MFSTQKYWSLFYFSFQKILIFQTVSPINIVPVPEQKQMSLLKSVLWMGSLSWAVVWALSVSPTSTQQQVQLSGLAKVLTCLFFVFFLIRALLGPEEAETGSVPPPMGRHLLCASWTHVHVSPTSRDDSGFQMWCLAAAPPVERSSQNSSCCREKPNWSILDRSYFMF